jgi:hypothetical protein
MDTGDGTPTITESGADKPPAASFIQPSDSDIQVVAEVVKKDGDKKSTSDSKKVLNERLQSVVRHASILFAFTHFDSARTGTLLVRDVETLLLSLGLCLSRSQIGRQLRQIGSASLKQDAIHYRKYTDAQVVKETFESRHEPLLMPYTVDDVIALARDNIHVSA